MLGWWECIGKEAGARQKRNKKAPTLPDRAVVLVSSLDIPAIICHFILKGEQKGLSTILPFKIKR
jgi:hypothetical protein